VTRLPRILRETPEERAASQDRLREAMARDLRGADIFGDLVTDSELTELKLRLESAECKIAEAADSPDYGSEAAMARYETGLLIGDVLMARDRLWGELG